MGEARLWKRVDSPDAPANPLRTQVSLMAEDRVPAALATHRRSEERANDGLDSSCNDLHCRISLLADREYTRATAHHLRSMERMEEGANATINVSRARICLAAEQAIPAELRSLTDREEARRKLEEEEMEARRIEQEKMRSKVAEVTRRITVDMERCSLDVSPC